MAKATSLLAQFAWTGGGRLAAALVQAVTFVVLARAATPPEFGAVAAATGVVVVAQAFLDLGVTAQMTKVRAAQAQHGSVRTSVKYTVASSLLLGAIGVGVLLVVGSLGAPLALALAPLSLQYAFERIADVLMCIPLADGNSRPSAINLLTRRIMGLALLVGLLVAGGAAVLSFTLAMSAAALMNACTAYAYTRRMIPAAQEPLRALIRSSRPFWVNSVAVQARTLDATVVAAVGGAHMSGVYAAASRLTSTFRIIPNSLAAVLLPGASRAHSSGAGLRHLARPSGIVFGASSVLYLVGAALAPWLIPLVLGVEYRDSVGPTQVILLGMPFAAATSLLTSILQGVGYQRYVGIVAVIFTTSALALVALGALLGPVQAALGLSISFVVQAALLGGRLMVFLRRRRR